MLLVEIFYHPVKESQEGKEFFQLGWLKTSININKCTCRFHFTHYLQAELK